MKALEKTYFYMTHYREIVQFVDSIAADKMIIKKVDVAELIIIEEYINRALRSLQADTMIAGYVYKYNAFVMHYIDGVSYENIRMILNCGKNTPRRWCDEMVKLLSIKLFGIRGIENDLV